MKKTFKSFGLVALTVMLAFTMAVVGCSNPAGGNSNSGNGNTNTGDNPGNTPGGNNTTLPAAKGKLTINGLGGFDGKYIYGDGLTANGIPLFLRVGMIGPENDPTFKLAAISGGKAEVPLYYIEDAGAVAVYKAYEGNDRVRTLNMYIVEVAELKTGNLASVLTNNLGTKRIVDEGTFSGGNLTINWGGEGGEDDPGEDEDDDPVNQTPVATDYDIGNLNQTAGSVTAVTITPKAGKSSGNRTIYYDGSTTLPMAAGSYAVTFDVAAASGWNPATGLLAGTLTVALANIVPVSIDMVWIPAGTFMMGSPSNEPWRWYDETQHQVTLTKGFYMGKYEVTQEQYQSVVGSNPSYFTGSDLPVERVSWYDAVEFCNALSQREGLTPAYTIDKNRIDPNNTSKYDDVRWVVTRNPNANGYRLPTEAEWEYACRAGTTTAYYTGNTFSEDTGWVPNNSDGTTHPVGQKLANAWGLYDMYGNVMEWCWDWYENYTSGAQTDPTGAVSGEFRLLRGGGWADSGHRSACRQRQPLSGGAIMGFRVVRP